MSINISPESLASYDEMQYTSFPYAQTHPNNLAAIAKLFNMEAAQTATSRILELGCGCGGNIIPIALAYPKAEVVGVDLSKSQIDIAQQQIKDLKLNNIKFHHASILDIDDSYGQFDYIIAHGVMSWVAEPVRQKIFDICGQLLSQKGIAYISYNALPGWNMVRSIREMMLFHSATFASGKDKLEQGKLFLEFVKDSIGTSNPSYSQIIADELQIMSENENSYARHDHMSEENNPYYLHKFVEEADKRGLQYLGDTNLAAMYLGNLPPEASAKLSQVKDVVRTEQYMDFISNRRFRSTLLCRKSASLHRALSTNDVEKFYLSLNITPEVPFDASLNLDDFSNKLNFIFENNKENIISTSSRIMKAILYTFAENTLTPLKVDQIIKIANEKLPNCTSDEIRQELINNAMSLVFSGHIVIKNEAYDGATKIDAKPILYKLARYQAEHNDAKWVTTTKHAAVSINILEKCAFRYMDGKHTKEEIINSLLDKHILKGEITVNKNDTELRDPEAIKAELNSALDRILQKALHAGLLVQGPSKSK